MDVNVRETVNNFIGLLLILIGLGGTLALLAALMESIAKVVFG